ncbi:MAG TPA: hypothetical protein ENJ45_00675 [Phaeodactylibacter sp.]|nr:hypothetical protein [Phaeodactylibacter sp.]
MEQNNSKNDKRLNELISTYEELSQQGAVVHLEETEYLEIVQYYQNQNMLDEALEVISLAIHQNSYSPQLFMRKAELLLTKGYASTALDFLDRAELLDPADVHIKMTKIEVMIEQGQQHTALSMIACLEPLIEKPLLSHLHFLKAEAFEAQRAYKKMFRALAESVRINPDNQNAIKKLWLAAELSGCFQESAQLHQKLLDLRPYSSIAWYNLGNAYLKLDNLIDAEIAFEYAFITNKHFEDAYRDCAEVRILMNNYQGALDCYEDMLALFKPEASLFVNIGYCYEKLEQFDFALTCYEKSFRYNCHYAHAFYRKGMCLWKLGNTVHAAVAIEQALEIQKNNELYTATLAELYCIIGQTEKADDLYYAATGLRPDESEPWIKYVRFLLDKQRFEDASELMREAEMYVQDAEIFYAKAVCFFLTNNKKDALRLLKKALKKEEDLYTMTFHLYPALKNETEWLLAISTHLLDGKEPRG